MTRGWHDAAAVLLVAAAAGSLRLPWRSGPARGIGWDVLGPPVAPAVATVAGLAVFALVMHHLPGHLPAEHDPARPRWAGAARLLAVVAGLGAATAGIAVLVVAPAAPGPWTALGTGLAAVALTAAPQCRHPS